MKVYVAVCNDRHTDPEITLHWTRDAAIQHARAFMADLIDEPDDLEETEWEGGWSIQFTCNEDDAYVVEAELPPPPETV